MISWGRTKQGFCSYVSSIAMRKSDLGNSSKSKKVMRGVDFRLLNGSFSPIKVKKTVKVLDLETVSNDLLRANV